MNDMNDMNEQSHSERSARSQMESILEMYRAYWAIENDEADTVELDGQEFDDVDDIQERAMESVLSVDMRSGWTACGNAMEAEEFRIVLCTGGPEVVILGQINQHDEPTDPVINHRDWGTTYQGYYSDADDADDALEWFCRQFYFGE